jgi:hypothetical protein
MKNSVKSMLVVAAAVTVTIFGCKKEETIAPTPNPASSGNSLSIASFLNKKEAPKQTFTINANQYQRVKGSKGTIIDFSPNSFKTQSGQPVSGSVTIELREMYSKSDMIFSKAPTMSNHSLLVSGGELYLQAFQNGSKLELAGSDKVNAKFPVQNNIAPMAEFYNPSGSFEDRDEPIDWYSGDYDSTGTDSVVVMADSIEFQEYYTFNLDGMNWINCDYFYNSPGPFTDITVNVGTQFNASNCVVYVSFDGMSSLASLYTLGMNNTFSYGYPSIPEGLGVHIVAIANINGQYYSAIVPATLSANFSTNVTLTPTTEAQITTAVGQLP